MPIKLSICIPTYNRCEYLKEAIESIVKQMTDEVEIVISDNASIDDTEDMIGNYQKKYKNIVYFRADENKGADWNYLRVIELAKGEYCWFLGSDDTIKENGIYYILNELKNNNDIYIVNRTECNVKMIPIRERYWLNEEIGDSVYDFSKREDILKYFNLSQSLGSVFSYLSSIVFRKRLWDTIKFDEKFLGTAYGHVYKLLGCVEFGARLKYIKKSLVNCRMGNDFFASDGEVARIMLDLNGYKRLANKFFADDIEVKKSFLHIMKMEHRLSYFSVFKLYAKTSLDEYKKMSDIFIYDYGIYKNELKSIAHISHGFSRSVYEVYKFIKKLLVC